MLSNKTISFVAGNRLDFGVISTNYVPNYAIYSLDPAQNISLYRYDQSGNRIDNITDWGLEQFRAHYATVPTIYNVGTGHVGTGHALSLQSQSQSQSQSKTETEITKLDIFHYTYGVLHNPAYRKKYELNLKREFPRLPFYNDFYKWVSWGKELMDLHINYESVEPHPTVEARHAVSQKENPKAKLRRNKETNEITLDENTTITGIPEIAFEYKLGNRSAIDWILDQYKEKKPRDKTIREKFNTYRFADYKDTVIDLIKRVTTVSVRTMEIVNQMAAEEPHED